MLACYPILTEKKIDHEIATTFAIWFQDEQREIYKENERKREKELKELIDFINKKIYKK